MDIKSFKSGTYRKGFKYKYFLPEKINHNFIISGNNIQEMLEKASFKLGELNSYAHLVPDIDTFIKSYVKKEAVTSSRIEGIRTNIEEAFSDELDIDPEYRDDWQEVNQYVEAMNFALDKLKTIPLSNRLLKDAHKILLSQVRGEHKQPGEFRKSQNWIGGATINDASFIPPAQKHVPELMSDLELFLHNEQITVPHLMKIAIAHYQFETIHPFLDGNGRIGRMLITLYLVSKGILEGPLLYSSDFFDKHKSIYIDRLSFAREKNDLSGWINFFLVAVEQTAEKATSDLQLIIKLKEKLISEKITTLGKKVKNAQTFLNFLFSSPVVSTKAVEKELGLTFRSAGFLIDDFVKLEILKEITGQKRNRLFVFREYLDILKR